MGRWNRAGGWLGLLLICSYGLFTASHLNRSLWYDEIFTFNLSRFGLVYNLTHYPVPNHHLLHTLLVGIFPADAPAWLIRLPAWCAGMLSLFGGWLVLQRWDCSVWERLISLTLIITNPFFFVFSVQARGYAFQCLGVVLLLLGLLRFREKDTSPNSNSLIGTYLIWGLGLLCLCYSVPTGLLMVAPFLIGSVIYLREPKIVEKSFGSRFQYLFPTGFAVVLLGILFLPLYQDISSNASMGEGSGGVLHLTSLLGQTFGGGAWGIGLLAVCVLVLLSGFFCGLRPFVFIGFGMILLTLLAFSVRGQAPFVRNFLPLTFTLLLFLGPPLLRGLWGAKIGGVAGVTLIGLSIFGHVNLSRDIYDSPNRWLHQTRKIEQWDKLFKQLSVLSNSRPVVISQVPKAHSHFLGVGHYLPSSRLASADNPEVVSTMGNAFDIGGAVLISEARLINDWPRPPQKEYTAWGDTLLKSFEGKAEPTVIPDIEYAKIINYQFVIPSAYQTIPMSPMLQITSKKSGESEVEHEAGTYHITAQNQPISVLLGKGGWTSPGVGTAVLAYEVSVDEGVDISLLPTYGTFKRDEFGPFIQRSVLSDEGGPANLVQVCWLRKGSNGRIAFLQPALIQPLTSSSWRVYTWAPIEQGESVMPCLRFSVGYKKSDFRVRMLWQRFY